jgi:DNA-binding response OmpR family regulator
MRIGILEDDPAVRCMLSEMLEYAGHEPYVYMYGWDFLDQVIKDETTPILNVFDLAIIDMALPGISGVQVIDVLDRIYPQLPIIIISAGSMRYLLSVKQRYPKVSILQKPFKFDDLLKLVERSPS